MGRLLILLLYFFTYHYAFSQSLDLELKNIPVEIKNRRFYISEVIDSRTDTGRIGWSVLNRETRGMPFLFTKGSVNELKQYFLKNLPPDTASVPLILNIVSLYIAESGTIMKEGKAYASIEFLREKNGRYGKLFSTTAYTESVSEIARDIYTTHERRIRIVLNKCLENLAESGWEKKVPDYVTLAEIQQESALADTISRKMADTTGLFQTAATRKVIEIQAKSIEVKGRFIPQYRMENKRHRQLWSYGPYFKNSDDKETQKLFTDYKGRFRLTFIVLGLGAALTAFSFGSDVNEGGPDLSLLVPGAVFTLCSVPLYIKTNKLGRKTVNRYNTVIKER